ncbi:hypothetical protein SAMN04487957_1178 [Halomonas shengliensis]|uniref:Uncharacterized protein n=1 Tax=Halomonas shengliensis TaxID=419597 RepID=A0A1H0NPF3_9GAMM|nr:hypothetical protein [Halomonas shengliensis]SDO94456.1 hypothetical protein SAMN04487957_1178 [Halomonas shengliensis]
MRIKKRPIHKSAWGTPVNVRVVEVSDCAEIRTHASPYGDSAISLDTTAFFLDGGGQELELINPSAVVCEIEQYGAPGVRSIVGHVIDREELKPGEEKFWGFYLGKVVPACLGSNEKGEQKRLRQSCIKTLLKNETLLNFITHVVLPGEDMTKPNAYKKLFNNAFSKRTIEHDLTALRKKGVLPTSDVATRNTAHATSEEKSENTTISPEDGEEKCDHVKNERDENTSQNTMNSVPKEEFIDPDSEEQNITPSYQHHINTVINKHLGLNL